MPEPTGSARIFDGHALHLDIEDWPAVGRYEVVHHLGAAGVLPVTPCGDVLLVKQFRPAVRASLTEIPAGLLDVPGEDALSCAARELMEETGYGYSSIEFLGGYYASPGFTDEYVHLFVAETEPEPRAAPEEGIEVVQVAIDRMIGAAKGGRVRDVKTAMALLLYAGRRPIL